MYSQVVYDLVLQSYRAPVTIVVSTRHLLRFITCGPSKYVAVPTPGTEYVLVYNKHEFFSTYARLVNTVTGKTNKMLEWARYKVPRSTVDPGRY